MTKTDLAYIAGIVDGEGYVGVKKSKPYKCQGRQTPGYHEMIQIRMVDEPAIKFIAETLGGWYYKEKPNAKNGRPLYCYQVSDLAATAVIKKLLPLLRVKKRQAELVMELRRLKSTQKREEPVRHERSLGMYGQKGSPTRWRFSQPQVDARDNIWHQCRLLNGLARFQ